MKITNTIIMYSYFDDNLQVLCLNQKDQNILPQFNCKKNIRDDIYQNLKNEYKLKLNDDQIIDIKIKSNIQNKIELISYITLSNHQINKIKNDNELSKNINFLEINHLINLNDNEKKYIKKGHQHIINRYKLYKLNGIKYLLPKRFTTYSLSSLLSKITHTFIKPNNMARDLKNQIIIIDYDHSHRGRPKAIFEFRKKQIIQNNH